MEDTHDLTVVVSTQTNEDNKRIHEHVVRPPKTFTSGDWPARQVFQRLDRPEDLFRLPSSVNLGEKLRESPLRPRNLAHVTPANAGRPLRVGSGGLHRRHAGLPRVRHASPGPDRIACRDRTRVRRRNRRPNQRGRLPTPFARQSRGQHGPSSRCNGKASVRIQDLRFAWPRPHPRAVSVERRPKGVKPTSDAAR